MQLDQLQQGLQHAFFTDVHRLVFWYDAPGHFADALDELALDGVQILDMAGQSTFGVKLRLELEESETPTLLYFPYAEPTPEDDWLLDIKLYSGRYYADRISMIFNELGLTRHALREHLAQRQAFLGSRKRIEALKRLVTPEMDEDGLDLAMCAAVVGAPASDIATLLFHLADEAVAEEVGLEGNPSSLEEMAKYALVPSLVRALQLEVGYPATQAELSGEAPLPFGQLMLRLLITGYCESISEIPDWAQSHAITSVNARATSRALLSRWRDSSRFYPAFDVISGWVAEGRLHDWKLPRIPNQQHFFRDVVRPHLDAHRNKRLVVIISDAFRYEAAEELRERINAKRYSEAILSSQLGVVPSYTTLGMASLLPHRDLSYQPGSDSVLVDGKSSQGTENRSQRLSAAVGGQAMAATAEEVKGWSREQGREAIKGMQLVYVYHNVVDARGDAASTESETLAAVEDAIEELDTLTRKILMHLNTSTVLVTADHGFLFQRSKLDDTDRTSLTEKPAGAFKSKKRYVLGTSLPDNPSVWHGHTRETAGTTCDTEFWIPKGAHRFHFVGGARFVHGGIMPQEIAVPVLTVKQLRGEKVEKRTRRKVDVISPKASLKMVNNIQRFDLLQTEAVSEQLKPITLAVAIYEGSEAVSSEETVTFDSTSDNMNERMKSVRLSLSGTDFDRQRDYFLVLRDKDLGTELERYRVVIDLAFTDDFF